MPILSPIGLYIFLLGLATGLTVLTLTAYRRASPPWLRWLLIALGGFTTTRYLTMALFVITAPLERLVVLRPCWLASMVGLTIPSVFAVDQLVKHPAMSAKRLLRWLSPLLVAYAVIILFANFTSRFDPLIGWTLHLSPGWRWVAAGVQTVFVTGFLGLCVTLMLQRPSRRIWLALLGLVVSHGYLSLDGILVAMGGWYVRPFLYSEILTLLALWYAYETAASPNRS